MSPTLDDDVLADVLSLFEWSRTSSKQRKDLAANAIFDRLKGMWESSRQRMASGHHDVVDGALADIERLRQRYLDLNGDVARLTVAEYRVQLQNLAKALGDGNLAPPVAIAVIKAQGEAWEYGVVPDGTCLLDAEELAVLPMIAEELRGASKKEQREMLARARQGVADMFSRELHKFGPGSLNAKPESECSVACANVARHAAKAQQRGKEPQSVKALQQECETSCTRAPPPREVLTCMTNAQAPQVLVLCTDHPSASGRYPDCLDSCRNFVSLMRQEMTESLREGFDKKLSAKSKELIDLEAALAAVNEVPADELEEGCIHDCLSGEGPLSVIRCTASAKSMAALKECGNVSGPPKPTNVGASTLGAGSNQEQLRKEAQELAEKNQKSCDAGDGEACFNLAWQYQLGFGVSRDGGTAVKLYKKACDSGFLKACVNYAKLVHMGFGGAGDDDGARAALKRACDGRVAEICTSAGKVLNDKQVYPLAAELFARACGLGDLEGCFALAGYFSEGKGVNQDLTKALEFARKACEGGYSRACSFAGRRAQGVIGGERGAEVANGLFEKGCSGRDAPSCFNMGVSYGRGDGVPKNHVKAAKFFQSACDGGVNQACATLGTYFEQGLGVRPNIRKARELYRQACDGGHAVGCALLQP